MELKDTESPTHAHEKQGDKKSDPYLNSQPESQSQPGLKQQAPVDSQASLKHELHKLPGGKPGNKLLNTLVNLVREAVELIVVTLVLLIVIRWALAEARYIPSSSMEPTLQIEDRLLVEKWSGHLGKAIKRRDILVFYPPPSEMGGEDLHNDPLRVLGRLTGLPFLPYEPAFIKRAIGLPGDRIRVQKGVGVFINDKLLDEFAYVKERPNYDLNVLGDIGGRSSSGAYISPYEGSVEPIIVPPGHLFMLGDNRNNSEDSHVWGFLDQKRVIGRAWVLFWRRLEPLRYFDQSGQDSAKE